MILKNPPLSNQMKILAINFKFQKRNQINLFKVRNELFL